MYSSQQCFHFFSRYLFKMYYLTFQVIFIMIYYYFTLIFLVPVPPTGVIAVQDGLNSIIVTWTASSDTTGYRIFYNSSGGDSGSADVSTSNHTLTGLMRGNTYTISITATYPSLISSSVAVEVTLSKFRSLNYELIFFHSPLQTR